MTNLFSFAVRENPLVKAELPYNLKVDLGEELAAVWSTDQMSGLLLTEKALSKVSDPYTKDQVERLKITPEEIDWVRRSMNPEATPEDRDALQLERVQLAEKRTTLNSDMEAERVENGQLLNVETLTGMYGDLLTFDRPMAQAEAEILYFNKKKEYIRGQILSRGDSGKLGAAAKFGVALLDVATDPVELAVGFASALLMPWSGGTLPTRLGLASAEAFVGSVLTEPAYYALSKHQQLDYTMNDALLNIGLGTLLGGGIGAIFGPRAGGSLGDIRAPRDGFPLLTSREVDVANVALRQFHNDEPINLRPFMNDLRATTSLTTFRGIDFQPEYTRNLMGPQKSSPITTLKLGPDNTPFRYKTVTKADAAAEISGGDVYRAADGQYSVRQPIDGDFLRDPRGDPVTFDTERSAKKFIDAAQEGLVAKDARAVPIFRDNGRPLFGIGSGFDDATLKDISTGRTRMDIPKGIDTRELTRVASPDQVIDSAVRDVANVRGKAAYREVAREYSVGEEAQVKAEEVVVDATPAEAELEIANYKAMLGDEVDEQLDIKLKQIEDEKAGRIDGIKEAMNCMTRNAI